MGHRRIAATGIGFVLGAAFCLAPLAWLLRASVTPEHEILRHPPTLLPAHWTGEHFRTVLADPSVTRYLVNSLVVCAAATALALLLAVPAAWGLARGRGRWRIWVLAALVAVHLVPGVTGIAALYRVMDALGLLNTLAGVILVKGGALGLAVWLLAEAFGGVPRATIDAARLDGCRGLALVFRVLLPLAAPSVLAAGLLLFIGNWNAFFLPFVLLTDREKMTAAVGIYQYVGEHGHDLGKIAAMTLIAIAPVLGLFLLTRRLFWEHLVRPR